MDEISRRTMFNIQAEGLLDTVRSHFRELNEDEGLTPEDRQRLKTYLEHLVNPRAKELLQQKRDVEKMVPRAFLFAPEKANPVVTSHHKVK